MQFRVIVVTDPETQTQPQTHKQTGPITKHCAAKLSAQCNYMGTLCYILMLIVKP